MLKCKSCPEWNLKIEKWDVNLYLGKCENPNHASGIWLEIRKGRWKQVNVQKPAETHKMSSYQRQEFNKLQTPFWKMMGQKPKPEEIAYEKYLKSRNMGYGDAVLERNAKQGKQGDGKALERFYNGQ